VIHSDIVRHNARIIRRQVRGKSPSSRRLFYAVLRYGPLGPVLVALADAPLLQKEIGR
jgi:hypothetical protein